MFDPSQANMKRLLTLNAAVFRAQAFFGAVARPQLKDMSTAAEVYIIQRSAASDTLAQCHTCTCRSDVAAIASAIRRSASGANACIYAPECPQEYAYAPHR